MRLPACGLLQCAPACPFQRIAAPLLLPNPLLTSLAPTWQYAPAPSSLQGARATSPRELKYLRFATLPLCTETHLPTPATRCSASRGAPSPDGLPGISSSRERFGSCSLHWARTPAGPFSGRRAAHHAPGSPRQSPPPSPGRSHRGTRGTRLGSLHRPFQCLHPFQALHLSRLPRSPCPTG